MGECFFWYRPTWVVPDKRPLNGCVCVCTVNIRGHEASFYEAKARCHEATIEAEARKSEAEAEAE